MTSMNKFCIVFIFLIGGASFINAQNQQDLRIRVTNLEQDVAAMTRLVKSVRLDLEQIDQQQRTLNENMRILQSSMQELQTSQNTKSIALEAQIQQVLQSYKAEDLRNRQEILKDVYGRLESLASQTQASVDAVARSVNASASTGGSGSTTNFSDDFPQTGIHYVVQSGDSLSKIANQNNSRVKWIQDANRISDPRSLRVGKTIFVPQQ